MPCASYQWISTRRIMPFRRRTVATPLSFRHRPRPYVCRRNDRSLTPGPAAIVSICSIGRPAQIARFDLCRDPSGHQGRRPWAAGRARSRVRAHGFSGCADRRAAPRGMSAGHDRGRVSLDPAPGTLRSADVTPRLARRSRVARMIHRVVPTRTDQPARGPRPSRCSPHSS